MNKNDVRGYVVALSLVGFSAAWTAGAREITPKVDPKAQAELERQERDIGAREATLERKSAQVQRLVAQRRADARKPRPVRYVRVYAGGASVSGGHSSRGGGAPARSSGGGAPAPVRVAPVTSSGSS